MVAELERLLGSERVLSGAAVSRANYSDANTIDKNPPACVVFPESTEEVQSIVRWCNERQVPFTPRGAGTGLSGGALPALGLSLIHI